jgi:hypothetical protein
VDGLSVFLIDQKLPETSSLPSNKTFPDFPQRNIYDNKLLDDIQNKSTVIF